MRSRPPIITSVISCRIAYLVRACARASLLTGIREKKIGRFLLFYNRPSVDKMRTQTSFSSSFSAQSTSRGIRTRTALASSNNRACVCLCGARPSFITHRDRFRHFFINLEAIAHASCRAFITRHASCVSHSQKSQSRIDRRVIGLFDVRKVAR